MCALVCVCVCVCVRPLCAALRTQLCASVCAFVAPKPQQPTISARICSLSAPVSAIYAICRLQLAGWLPEHGDIVFPSLVANRFVTLTHWLANCTEMYADTYIYLAELAKLQSAVLLSHAIAHSTIVKLDTH